MADNLNIVLVGETGTGKSTIGNVLVHGEEWCNPPNDVFETGASVATSCTRSAKSIFSPRLGCNIVDTPGTEDLDRTRRVEMMDVITTAMHERSSIIAIVVNATRTGVDSTVRAIHAISRMVPLMDAALGILLIVNRLGLQVRTAEDAARSIKGARDALNKLLREQGCEFQVFCAVGMRDPDCRWANGTDLVQSVKAMLQSMTPFPAGACRKFSDELQECKAAVNDNDTLTRECTRRLQACQRSIKENEDGFRHNEYWHEHHMKNGLIMTFFPGVNIIGVPLSSAKAEEHASEMMKFKEQLERAKSEMRDLERERCDVEAQRKRIEGHVKLLDNLIRQDGGVFNA